MNAFDQYEVWFVTGAQLLYGGDAVVAVDAHSNEMVKGLNDSGRLPVKVVYKGTVNSSKEVTAAFKAANNDEKCIGVITWMHTFSPAKMWIHGLQELKKPLLHFHTQFNKEIPWETFVLYSERIKISASFFSSFRRHSSTTALTVLILVEFLYSWFSILLETMP